VDLDGLGVVFAGLTLFRLFLHFLERALIDAGLGLGTGYRNHALNSAETIDDRCY